MKHLSKVVKDLNAFSAISFTHLQVLLSMSNTVVEVVNVQVMPMSTNIKKRKKLHFSMLIQLKKHNNMRVGAVKNRNSF